MDKKALIIGAIVVVVLWFLFRPATPPSSNPQKSHMRTDSNTLEAVQAIETELKQSDAKAAPTSSPAEH